MLPSGRGIPYLRCCLELLASCSWGSKAAGKQDCSAWIPSCPPGDPFLILFYLRTEQTMLTVLVAASVSHLAAGCKSSQAFPRWPPGSRCGFGGDSQELTHEWVDVDAVKRLGQAFLLQIWPENSECGLHIREDIIKAMAAFVEIHSLKNNNNKKAILDSSPLKENCPLVNVVLVGSMKSLKI